MRISTILSVLLASTAISAAPVPSDFVNPFEVVENIADGISLICTTEIVKCDKIRDAISNALGSALKHHVDADTTKPKLGKRAFDLADPFEIVEDIIDSIGLLCVAEIDKCEKIMDVISKIFGGALKNHVDTDTTKAKPGKRTVNKQENKKANKEADKEEEKLIISGFIGK
ncbi:uncharacterized protein DFL_002992 [Arthrobotrys flagrans]|uniref:Cell wall protein n=1 Tax=Arthrobotrys flagrans TaxID=97331 RepID=A0A437AC29_ARTFL|nr:hypothetical protein DFL_002992 [Arthrobotrys flagrans]